MKTRNQIISKSDIKIIRNQAHDYEYKNMKFRLENDSIFKFCADQNGYVFFAKLNGRRGSETIADCLNWEFFE